MSTSSNILNNLEWGVLKTAPAQSERLRYQHDYVHDFPNLGRGFRTYSTDFTDVGSSYLYTVSNIRLNQQQLLPLDQTNIFVAAEDENVGYIPPLDPTFVRYVGEQNLPQQQQQQYQQQQQQNDQQHDQQQPISLGRELLNEFASGVARGAGQATTSAITSGFRQFLNYAWELGPVGAMKVGGVILNVASLAAGNPGGAVQLGLLAAGAGSIGYSIYRKTYYPEDEYINLDKRNRAAISSGSREKDNMNRAKAVVEEAERVISESGTEEEKMILRENKQAYTDWLYDIFDKGTLAVTSVAFAAATGAMIAGPPGALVGGVAGGSALYLNNAKEQEEKQKIQDKKTGTK